MVVGVCGVVNGKNVVEGLSGYRVGARRTSSLLLKVKFKFSRSTATASSTFPGLSWSFVNRAEAKEWISMGGKGYRCYG